MINFFNWTEVFTLSENFFFLDNIVSWEDLSFSVLHDFFFYFLLFFSNFTKIFWSLNTLSFVSLIDLVNLHQSTFFVFIYFFYLDFFLEIHNLNFFINFLFQNIVTNFQTHLFLFNPEALFFLQNFNIYVNGFTFTFTAVFYDSFFFTVSNTYLDFFNYFIWLLIGLVFLLVFSFLTHKSIIVSFSVNFFLKKFILFANTFAFENRLQLDWVLLYLFFCFLIWIPVLMTYDDVNTEFIEMMHFFICYFFIFIIAFLLFKYSIHYFAFLENSVSEGFSTNYIAKQFIRDLSNTFALFLRFFLLLFRLNIYDGLDDFLDSYYIFFIDFDEDSYLDELFFFSDCFFFFSDNREDVVFYQPVEFDWWFDIYSKYFIIFGKFFYFWAFILEEVFRMTLAIYISYLIIFEVHAVNTSFNEDSFMQHKRNNK